VNYVILFLAYMALSASAVLGRKFWKRFTDLEKEVHILREARIRAAADFLEPPPLPNKQTSNDWSDDYRKTQVWQGRKHFP